MDGPGRPPFCSLSIAKADEANTKKDIEKVKIQETKIIWLSYGQFVSVLTVDALVVEKEIRISFQNELIPINMT